MSAPEIETESTDLPTCPHCGCEDVDWWDGQPDRRDGEKWDAVCPSCNKDYKITFCVSYSFTTVRNDVKHV